MRRILVVENDIVVQQLIYHVLRRLYYDSIMVNDRGTASTALEQDGQIALVILSVGFPDSTALELLEFLANRYPTLPIIVISTHSHIFADALVKGAAHCMMKPFRVQELGHAMQRLLPMAPALSD